MQRADMEVPSKLHELHIHHISIPITFTGAILISFLLPLICIFLGPPLLLCDNVIYSERHE